MTITYYDTIDQYVPETYSEHYLHCVWGWGARGNGYYKVAGTIGKKATQPDHKYSPDIDFTFVNLQYLSGYTPDR